MVKYRFGIIGAGNVARFHALAIQDISSATLVGICDSGSGRGQILAREFGATYYPSYEALLNDSSINIVTIATPSGLHLKPTLLAAEKGKHVLCEKPLEITTSRIDEMIQACDVAGVRLGCFFNYRYDPVVAEIKTAIEEKRIGRITHAAVHVPWWRNEAYYQQKWRGTLALDGGGALMNQAIHMIDLLQYLMGPVEKLFAYTATLAHEIEVEDTAVAILRFKSGVLGHIYGSTSSFPGRPRHLEITGSKGTLQQVDENLSIWDFAEKHPVDESIIRKYQNSPSTRGAADPMAISYINHTRNLEAFLTAIDSKQPFEIDGPEARKAVAIIQAIYESQKSGKEIVVTS